MSQIAIGRNGKVELWCYVEEDCPNGRVRFSVINGGWQGSILNGRVTVEGTGEIHDGEILWWGFAPFGYAGYNEAIDYIQKEIER